MRLHVIIPLAGIALGLSACGGTVNRGLESVHQPVVSKANHVFDVPVTNGGLAPGDADRLSAWFDTIKLTYGDRIAIDDPMSGGLNSAIYRDVAELAARRGLMVSDRAPVTAGAVAPGAARVVVSRTVASVPGCPDWSRASHPDFGNNSTSNHGCATNSNLAAMIANPEELLQGAQAGTSADAAIAAKAIKAYRTKAPTGESGLKSQTVGGK